MSLLDPFLRKAIDQLDTRMFGQPLRQKEESIRLLEEQTRRMRQGRGV